MITFRKFLPVFILLVTACNPTIKSLPTTTPLPPIPTATLSPTPTATITPSPTAVPDGPCDNPLVPLVTGNVWEYRVTSSGEPALFTLQVNERKDKGNINIEVEIIDQRNGRDIKELVICDEGEIVNFPLYTMSMLLVDYFKGILNTYHFHESAPFAPRYADLIETPWTYTWEPNYLMEESVYIVNPMGGSDLFVSSTAAVDLVFRMKGQFEMVEVPGGVFPNALVVMVDYHMPVTVVEEVGGSGGSMDIRTTQWYVPFVGLVRAEIDSAQLKYYGQLLDTPIASLLELIQFTPGPAGGE